MRIGLTIDYYFPHAIGGAERSTRELARALVERGHEVAILTPNYGAVTDEVEHGVRIHRYWFPRKMQPGRSASALWIKNPAYYAWSGRLIARAARRLDLEILHAQNAYVQIPTHLAARRAGLPWVATIRDLGSLCAVSYLAVFGGEPDHRCAGQFRRCVRGFFDCYYPNAPLRQRLPMLADIALRQADLRWRQRVLRRCARVIFVSRGLRETYQRHGFPVAPERLAVAYNIPPALATVEAAAARLPEAWRLPDGARIISYAGKLSLGKGAHILFQAIPRVLARHPDAVFVFAGRPTPQVQAPPDLPPDNVRLLGRISSEEVHALLRRSTLFVLPSIWPEPFSSAVLEALAFGVPVIGTRTGGTPEQIEHGVNGWLVAPGDPVALAGQINGALDNPAALDRMRAACQRVLRERFDREKIVSQMLAIYGEAISGHGRDTSQ